MRAETGGMWATLQGPTQTPGVHATDKESSSGESDDEEGDEGDNSGDSDSDDNSESDDACTSTTVLAKRRLF